MIICGYQGIGKSSIAGKNNIIDLESGNFWHKNNRPSKWYIYYCNIAEHLSQQGYIVLLSSHKEVMDRLKKHCKEPVYLIYPSLNLYEEWEKKLYERYYHTQLSKDYKAWINAKDMYYANISDLEMCGIPHYEIESMDYKLSDMIDYLVAYEQQNR